jgi:cellulose synthase (UDP-forming)
MKLIDPAYEDHDDGRHGVRRALVVLTALTGAIYLAWRTTTFSPGAPVVSAIFYAGEALGLLSSLLLFFVVMRKKRRTPRPAPEGLSVDVLVPTYNEDIAIVRRTLVAAAAIRYPHQTWLLDDGNRPAFAALAAELGCRYLARRENRGAKAGNLNNALRHAKGDFVAIFDADHCAEPHFLDRLLGYFDDPGAAFVQTPQDYYNLGSFQHDKQRGSSLIWHEQSGFHHVEQPGRDHHNAATLCGCSCVIRRAHLDRIGGFPEETVTEDMHAAVRLQKLGLSTIYHDEPLAYGIAAPDFREFVRQRLRWGEGNMQVCRIEGVPFSRELTWRQNLCYLLLSTVYIDAWRKLVLFLAPPLTILAQTPPVAGEPGEFALYFLPYLVCGLLAYYAHFGRFSRIVATEIYSMARLPSGLLATWGLVRRRIPFRVSAKRQGGAVPWAYMLPVLAVLAASLAGLAHTAMRFTDQVVALTSVIPLWIELGLALVCAYHAALSIAVLRLAVRSSSGGEAVAEHAMRLPLTVTGRVAAPAVLWTSRVSLDRIAAAGEIAARPGEYVQLDLHVPSGRIRVAARCASRSRKGGVVLDLDWANVADRDALDQLLHAGRWHRVAEGRSELLPRRGPRRARGAGAWEPVLAVRRGGDPVLAYVSAASDTPEVIAFGAAARPGRPLEVLASWSGRYAGASIELHGTPSGALLDEGALEAAGGVRADARIVQRLLNGARKCPEATAAGAEPAAASSW